MKIARKERQIILCKYCKGNWRRSSYLYCESQRNAYACYQSCLHACAGACDAYCYVGFGGGCVGHGGCGYGPCHNDDDYDDLHVRTCPRRHLRRNSYHDHQRRRSHHHRHPHLRTNRRSWKIWCCPCFHFRCRRSGTWIPLDAGGVRADVHWMLRQIRGRSRSCWMWMAVRGHLLHPGAYLTHPQTDHIASSSLGHLRFHMLQREDDFKCFSLNISFQWYNFFKNSNAKSNYSAIYIVFVFKYIAKFGLIFFFTHIIHIHL